jgi:hypothetical protein
MERCAPIADFCSACCAKPARNQESAHMRTRILPKTLDAFVSRIVILVDSSRPMVRPVVRRGAQLAGKNQLIA